MSGAPVKKLPASPSVSSPSVPVADRGGEGVNVGFSNFGAGSGNQLRDPRARVGHAGGSWTPGGSLRDGGWHPLEFTALVRNSGISLKS